MCVSSCWRELEENQKSNKTLDNWAELPRVSRCPKIRKGEEEERKRRRKKQTVDWKRKTGVGADGADIRNVNQRAAK